MKSEASGQLGRMPVEDKDGLLGTRDAEKECDR